MKQDQKPRFFDESEDEDDKSQSSSSSPDLTNAQIALLEKLNKIYTTVPQAEISRIAAQSKYFEPAARKQIDAFISSRTPVSNIPTNSTPNRGGFSKNQRGGLRGRKKSDEYQPKSIPARQPIKVLEPMTVSQIEEKELLEMAQKPKIPESAANEKEKGMSVVKDSDEENNSEAAAVNQHNIPRNSFKNEKEHELEKAIRQMQVLAGFQQNRLEELEKTIAKFELNDAQRKKQEGKKTEQYVVVPLSVGRRILGEEEFSVAKKGPIDQFFKN